MRLTFLMAKFGVPHFRTQFRGTHYWKLTQLSLRKDFFLKIYTNPHVDGDCTISYVCSKNTMKLITEIGRSFLNRTIT